MGNSSSKPNGLQTITSQITNLINKASDTIVCGPSCQREKKLADLKDKYNNAITNIKTAPTKLKEAKKNYFLEEKGPTDYNKMVLDKVTADANNVTSKLQSKFDANAQEVDNVITTYDTLKSNSDYIKQIIGEYSDENIKMAKELRRIRGDIITNDRKTYYEQQYVENLAWWYGWFRIVYIVLLIFFIIAVIFKVQGWIKKLLLIIIFIFYPMFISPVVSYLYNGAQHIMDFLPHLKNVPLN
jgi:hypothetical protein